jgi:hypothetical protein
VYVADTLTTPRDIASAHFAVDVGPTALEHVFALAPITDELIHTINPRASIDALAVDLAASGYPTGLLRAAE